MSDLVYREDFPFIRILPESVHGESAWREIANHFPSGVIPVSAWASTRSQLKKAGYTMRKLKVSKLKLSNEDNALLDALLEPKP